MKILVIIPAHNEENFIGPTLDSFIGQKRRPDYLAVVNDNSTDRTLEIARAYAAQNSWIKVWDKESLPVHQPGEKVVQAFFYGLERMQIEYDLLGKFDADILLPDNYFKTLEDAFLNDPNLGMAGGLLYIQKNGKWEYENIADRSHLRGPIKLYRKACFTKIGGIRPTIGWDTLDVLLARFNGYKVYTFPELKVKHLRPTGKIYRKKDKMLKGVAFYKMRYGLVLSSIAAFKMAVQQKNAGVLINALRGYAQAYTNGLDRAVSREEGKFIRAYRWQKIRKKLIG